MMRRPSITFRLTLMFAAASLAALVTAGLLTRFALHEHFEEMDRDELTGKVELIRHVLAKVQTTAGFEALAPTLDDALVGHPGLAVAIRTADGKTLYATVDAAFPGTLLASPAPAPKAIALRTWREGDVSYRGLAVSLPTGIPKAPPLTVALSQDIEHHARFLDALGEALVFAVLAGSALAALLGWIAARRGLAPLNAIAARAQDISAEGLSERLSADKVPVELVGLVASLNGMLARLEASFRRLSEFSSDLAHELRTPISNLMTQTEVSLSRERSADEYRDILYSNLEEYDRLARTIGDMLFLAKAEHGLMVPSRQPLDLGREVDALFEFYEALAGQAGVRLERSGDARIAGDALMLRRAISNLLANAIRHAPSGSVVTVAIRQDGAGVRLSVANTGEPIPAEHLPRLFDRFFRGDASRHRKGEGAGLGLAITKSIVEAHGGSIGVSSAANRTCFEISLSSAEAERSATPRPAKVLPG